MNERIPRDRPRPTSLRLALDVREALEVFCRTDRRSLNSAINLLVAEALAARGVKLRTEETHSARAS